MKKISIGFILILCLAWAGGWVWAQSPGEGRQVIRIALHVFGAAETWTLSAVESICNVLSTTSGDSNSIIVAPKVSGRVYIARNAGLGTLTIKASGGTGVAIASGKTATVVFNGVDYQRVTADAAH